MSKSRNMADLLDSNGDVKSGALDNVPPADVVNDTTPQLGGDLASNGNDITFGDNDKAIFGAGSDLQIYHNGNNSFIEDSGTGDFYIRGADNVRIQSYSDNEDMAKFIKNGAASLYYDNSPKIATTSTGIDVTGDVNATGSFIGGGAILQVVNTTDTTRRKFTNVQNNSWRNSYGYINTTITPKSNDSKLIFFVDVHYGVSDRSASAIFHRIIENNTLVPTLNGTENAQGWGSFGHVRWNYYASDLEYTTQHAQISGGIVSNTSTSARTFEYEFRVQDTGNDISFNRDGSSSSDSSRGSHSPTLASRMTIIEVAN
jgi:hypothetical protein